MSLIKKYVTLKLQPLDKELMLKRYNDTSLIWNNQRIRNFKENFQDNLNRAFYTYHLEYLRDF